MAIDFLLEDALTTMKAHHGDCIGADEQFHKLANLNGLYIIGHPPLNQSKRAFCNFSEERPAGEYLDRNKDIVDESDWMIFGPEGEEKLRSGTWSTVRYAIRRHMTGKIVWPEGWVQDLSEYNPKF